MNRLPCVMNSMQMACRSLGLAWCGVVVGAIMWTESVDGSQAIEIEIKKLVAIEDGEKEKLAKDESLWQEDLRRLRDVRRELASHVIELEMTRGRLAEKTKQLASTILNAREDEEAKSDALNDIYACTKMTAEELNIYGREQPAGLLAMDSSKKVVADILDADDVAVSHVVRLVELVGQIHEEGVSIAIRNESVRDPDGVRHEAEVIQVGHVGAYYLAQGRRRVGIALDSPRDASGFRWNEAMLSDAEIGGIIDAAEVLRASDPVSVELPIDVTTVLRDTDLSGRSGVRQWFVSGGLVMYPLVGVAVLAMTMVGQRLWVLAREGRGGASVARAAIRMCRQGDCDRAAETLAESHGVVPRTLHACLSHRAHGQHAMEDRIQEQLLYEMPRLQRFLGGIAVLAAVAPLLGLLGTVTGIIQTFGVIKSYGATDPGMMAGGISEALVTTASGLIIAIPILLFHSLLRGRVERIISDAEKHAATLLNCLLVDKR